MGWLKTLATGALLLANTQALAQEKPLIIHQPDTTYTLNEVVLDSVLVTPNNTPKRIKSSRQALAHANPIHHLAKYTGIQTVIPGVSAEPEANIPGQITFYNHHNLPILTSSTQNHSLTSTIPSNLTKLQLDQPNAQKTSADAVITLTQQYHETKNLHADPLHQVASYATGEDNKLQVAIVAENNAPGPLEHLIEELSAYATTQSIHAATRLQTNNTEAEIITNYQVSDNEFGELFDAHLFQEIDKNTSIFTNAQQTLGEFTLQASYAHQQSSQETHLEEIYKKLHTTIDQLTANNYQLAIHNPNTTLSFQHHDLKRAKPDTTTHHHVNQLTLSHQRLLGQKLHVQAQTRIDHHQTTNASISTQATIKATNNLALQATLASLHDAVTNHQPRRGLREATTHYKSTSTNQASMQATYTTNSWFVETQLQGKKIDLHWYGQPATINATIIQARAQHTINNPRYTLVTQTNIQTRNSRLETPTKTTSVPGPAALQTSLQVEYARDNFSATASIHYHSNREQALDAQTTASLGQLCLLNLGVTKQIGKIQAGLSISNALSLVSKNKVFAYQKRTSDKESEITYVYGAPLPKLSINVDF